MTVAWLCSKNKDKKSESNSQRLQFNMSGCIPYRRRPPPVRNMRAVLKKASWGTRRAFRSPPCSKQASGVQKGYSVPETPFYGTGFHVYRERPPGVPNEAEERGSGSEIGDFAKNGLCILLLLPINSCRQLWLPPNRCKPLQTATKSLQTVMDYLKLPPTLLNYRRLPRPTARLPPSHPDRYRAPANYVDPHQRTGVVNQ